MYTYNTYFLNLSNKKISLYCIFLFCSVFFIFLFREHRVYKKDFSYMYVVVLFDRHCIGVITQQILSFEKLLDFFWALYMI